MRVYSIYKHALYHLGCSQNKLAPILRSLNHSLIINRNQNSLLMIAYNLKTPFCRSEAKGRRSATSIKVSLRLIRSSSLSHTCDIMNFRILTICNSEPAERVFRTHQNSKYDRFLSHAVREKQSRKLRIMEFCSIVSCLENQHFSRFLR